MLEITSNHIFQIAFSAGLFLLLWAVLGGMIFKPFFRMLEEREDRTVGDERAAAAALEETKVRTQDLEKQLLEARIVGMQDREKRIQKAKEEATALVGEANLRAAEELKKIQEEIAQLKQRAINEVEAEAKNLSRLVVRQVAGDSGQTVH